MWDIDAALWLEDDDLTKEPLALIETARDVGQGYKSGTVLHHLAKRARLPAYVCMYRLGDKPNPADPRCYDVASFKVRRVYPWPESGCGELLPEERAAGLVRIREWSAGRVDQSANDSRY